MSAFFTDESILRKFDTIKDDIVKLVSNESLLQEKIKLLEADLNVYKRIFGDTNLENKRLQEACEKLKQDCDRQKEVFEKQLQASRVVALLDGDGAIFNPQLIAQGQAGGHHAASQLTDSVKDCIFSTGETRQFQLWAYIFFNKRGLADTFGRCGYHAAKQRLEDFVIGFNQAAERFTIIDVGSGKEAADSKIKAFLDDEIRLPQTFKVLFGGCHDNGYVTTIRSHITSGFKQKFILLRSYAEHAAGFDDLELPTLSIPGLFITQKLGTPAQTQDLPTPSGSQTPPLSDPPILDNSLLSGSGPCDSPHPNFEPSVLGPRSSPPTSYSSILLKKVERRDTVDSDSSSDTNDDDTSASSPESSLLAGGIRRLNPKVALSKQKPPPCTLFYLANSCKHGSDCRYAHNYILESEHYAEIKSNAKKSPCPAVNRGEICTWGANCCYGHVCPLTTKCHYLKLGKCKFIGADMHKEPKDSKNALN